MDLEKLSTYDYNLPKELIAQNHAIPADTSRLLYFNWTINDLIFKDIANLLSNDDVLFFNNSKVVKARIIWDSNWEQEFFIIKDFEEKKCLNCEILFLKKISENSFEALVRPWKKFKIWTKIKIVKDNKEYNFEILGFTKEWRIIKYLWKEDIFDVLEQIWQMPLPPYIEYSKDKEKPYQPIQAKNEWSVAAPTASLHFTEQLLKLLDKKWVNFLESTLHIWIWTFKIVDVEDITKYNIHSEMVEVPTTIFKEISKIKQKWKNIVAVGTTSTRILESLPYLYKKIQKLYPKFYEKIKNNYFDNLDISDDYIDWEIFIEDWIIYFNTKLFIYPWLTYKIVDKLITNFHLPKSSLLMLVSAFMWYRNMMDCYKYAINNKYKFFSFWDAMFINLKK